MSSWAGFFSNNKCLFVRVCVFLFEGGKKGLEITLFPRADLISLFPANEKKLQPVSEKKIRAPFFFLLYFLALFTLPHPSLTNNSFFSTTHFSPLAYHISKRNNNKMLHVPYVAGGSVRTFSGLVITTTTATNQLPTGCFFALPKGICNTKSTYTRSHLRSQLDNSHWSTL